jgi:glycogen debranching enzyme
MNAEEELKSRIHKLLLSNARRGYSGLLGQSYCYIAPAPDTYPFQWFWDTCFHVVMLARLGEYDLAKRNLRSLFAQQEENGFVGHMIFWKQLLPKRRSDVLQARPTWAALRPHMSALIQPPFAAFALQALYEACGDHVYLGEMYARVKRHHEWLAKNRDFDGDGLLTIISPFESGMDWKPSYDTVLGYRQRTTPRRLYTSRLYWKAMAVDFSNFRQRYDLQRIRKRARFLVKDAGFNAIYALDLESMEKLAPLVGDDPAIYRNLRHRVVQSMLEQMYDAEDAAFYDLRGPDSETIQVRTPTILFPLAIKEIDQEIAERVIEAHFDREDGFRVPLPLPSVELRDAAFFAGETPFIWRGPTWALNNWFLFHAFKKRGFMERAQQLRRSLQSLIERSGFREYYDPFTGEGHGAREFTWPGLLIDMN